MGSRQRQRRRRSSTVRALAIYRKLADDNPAVTSFRGELANATVGLAAAHLVLGRGAEARTAAEQSVVLLEALPEQERASQWRAVLGEALLRRGQAPGRKRPGRLGGRLAARGGDL